MNFKPKEDIKSKKGVFEAGNSYDSDKHELDAETVERWYAAGWTEIEGRDPAPERVVRGAVVKPDKSVQGPKEQKHG